MMPDPFVHFCLMAVLIAYSFIKKSGFQFIFVLIIYGAAWQMSDYLSHQEDEFIKVFFQTSVSSALIAFITNLKPTRFTTLFVGLLFINIASLFGLVLMDKFASIEAFNGSIGIFNLINIQLIYLELLALAGVTFDMGSGKRINTRSIINPICNRDILCGGAACAKNH